MSKRDREPTRTHPTKVKKRRGVGSRIINVPDSDEEGLSQTAGDEYARLTKTRVAASGEVEQVSVSTFPVLEVERSSTPTPLEEDGDYAADVEENAPPVRKKKRRKKDNDSTKTRSWLNKQSRVLDKIVSLDGPGGRPLNRCSSCSDNLPTLPHRCLECSYSSLHCGECIVKLHKKLPLHRVEYWRNGFFDRTTLHSLGLVCNLGHDGDPCPVGSSLHNITIIDLNGWHKVRVSFCTCDESTPWDERYEQLFDMRWYPASFDRPRTAFSFDLLETFHKLTLQGKLNLYDFYHGIMQKTDNQGRLKEIDRYHEISRCVRQWRHLEGIKRGGGAHQPQAISETKSGSFAIECPACPHPGRNLPEDWDAPTNPDRWKHAQFIAVDANFRLKLKNRKIQDPELGSGWSYFVENSAYTHHIEANPHQEEARRNSHNVTSCGTEFHAVNQANSRGGNNYLASGVVKAVCARHCFVLPNAVGDLQRGERYINTDYIVAEYLKRCQVRDIKISYDIACKWSVNFGTCFKSLHKDVDLSKLSITYLVPKFHLPAHGSKCHVRYSFNYARGVGRTHGETVEQEWSYINLAALSTREMGPGARHSALDDSWGGWNWKKVLGLKSLLKTNLVKAVEMASIQRKAATDFSRTFPDKTIKQWKKMVREWERDSSRPDPYVSAERALKLSEVRLQLAQEEVSQAERGQHAPHKVSASVFIRMGLELEDQQHSLLSKSGENARSDTQKANLFEKRGVLLHQIEKWRQLQAVYMPGALDADSADKEDKEEPSQRVKAESIILWLPSQLDPKDRDTICLGGVVKSEKELRLGQLVDSLNDLRRARRTRRGLMTFHKVQLAGQGQKTQTKSQAAMKTIQVRIDRSIQRYRVARNALLSLDPCGDWTKLYPPLSDHDNRGPGKEPEEIPGSDGKWAPSWIWTSTTSTVSRDEVNEDMRVEWAQSVARADRWEEEVTLLQEEMRRVVQFLEWRSSDWLAKADIRADSVSPAVQAGLSAYAKEQSALFHNLAVRFCQYWRSSLIKLSLSHNWATTFLETHNEAFENPGLEKKERKSKVSPIPHPSTDPSASAGTSADIAPFSSNNKTTNRLTQAPDIGSDGTSSENDESEDESTSGYSE